MRWRPSTRPSTRASPSSTPRMSTATGAASPRRAAPAPPRRRGLTVATKMGRRADQVPENFNPRHLPWAGPIARAATSGSSARPRAAALPATAVYSRDGVFEALDDAGQKEGGWAHTACRWRPARKRSSDRPAGGGDGPDHPQRLPPQAARRSCRPPPRRGRRSSPGCRWRRGCSAAATTPHTTFAADDHRNYNRHGEAFDVGETFAGVPTRSGCRPSTGCARWCPRRDHGAVRAALDRRPAAGERRSSPGRATRSRRRATLQPPALAPLGERGTPATAEVYDELIRPHVHHRW